MDRALHAGGAQVVAPFQPGFHQGPLHGQLLAPVRCGHRQGLQRPTQPPPPLGSAEPGQLQGLQRQRRIAFATEALVELHHALAQLGMGFPELSGGLGEVVEVVGEG